MNGKQGFKLDYSDWLLEFPWDIYSTITFREKRRDGYYWSKRFNQVLEKFDSYRAFVAVEPHKLDGIHLHAISRHIPYPNQLHSMWKYCFKAFGRSTIEAVADTMPVTRYCAKYVVKENDFFLFGAPEAWKYDRMGIDKSQHI